MLKRLLNRLHIIMTGILTVLITLIYFILFLLEHVSISPNR